MMMMMTMKDAWRYSEEDSHQIFDVTSPSASDSWNPETAEQFRDYDDDDRWQSTEDAGWSQERSDGGQDDWTERPEDQSNDWTLTDDFAAGGATEYDSSWTTEYNVSSNTADDNYNDDY